MDNRNNYLFPAAILGLSFIISVIIFTFVWKAKSEENQTINVTGSAKKEIVSNIGILRGSINVQMGSKESAYRELERQKPLVISYLQSEGFEKNKIEFFTINSYPIYETGSNGYQTQNVIGYVYNQRIEVQSNDVNKIKELSLKISSIIEKGVDFSVEVPEYYYTKIAELKIEVQAEAAKDAMMRAQKIAEATGRDLGTMTSARMGVLQITPRFSNMISDYGINDVSSIEKEITAVVNASFKID